MFAFLLELLVILIFISIHGFVMYISFPEFRIKEDSTKRERKEILKKWSILLMLSICTPLVLSKLVFKILI